MDSIIRSPIDTDNAAPDWCCLGRYRPNDSERKIPMPKATTMPAKPLAAPASTPDPAPEVLASMDTLWSAITKGAATAPAVASALARCRAAQEALADAVRVLEGL